MASRAAIIRMDRRRPVSARTGQGHDCTRQMIALQQLFSKKGIHIGERL